MGARDPQTAEVAKLAAETGAAVALPADAASAADMVILALPWGAAEAAVRSLGDLAGKAVIDCMNPLGGWLPGARVVKTLNQVGAEIRARNDHLPHRPVMFMAGDSDAAKGKAAALLAALGFEALDAGGLDMARLLEPLAMVWINQALVRGKGRSWALAAVTA